MKEVDHKEVVQAVEKESYDFFLLKSSCYRMTFKSLFKCMQLVVVSISVFPPSTAVLQFPPKLALND